MHQGNNTDRKVIFMNKNYNYKKTDNHWIPQIPEHWEELKAKHLGNFQGSTVDKKIVKGEKKIRMVNFTDVYGNENLTIEDDIDFMEVTAKDSQIQDFKISVGDMVFTPSSEIREDIGQSALVKYEAEDLLFSYHLVRLHFTRKIYDEFKKYLFNNKPALQYFSKVCKGSTRKILNRIDFKNLPVYLPPFEEQIAIANYLDAKCAEIQKFILKKQQLITLLKEQRQAIINDAVTKGINPDAEMKYSGFEWLGNIPAHWEMRRLKYSVKLNPNTVSDLKFDENFRKIALENIDNWTGNLIKSNNEEFEGQGVAFKKGNVLFNKLRPYLAKGFVATFDGLCVNELLVFEVEKEILNEEYLLRIVLTKNFIDLIDGSTYGAKMPRASWDFIGNIKIPLPEVEEQINIVKFIKTETANLDELISKTQKEIDLIKEYREALITEAVTGKIKVA